ncbi:ABC transporter substrate-binding protein [Desulfovibrio gilichinskyi]|uniref:Amino acid ABC transporter substrate-binding protein, PAAT family n=1 Tax=Desulfovibrio gilichinskyi TaxID=1519643 RepID=A0A1X7DE62_9BACT|nr:ABC transporter substrate-binding protein [Desulfovibrio gilichinskyi]SMF13672.1 amino acid ABC transporter substrate-binding protein, PAAT family [Desulfovibrio gilichinskyi]
MRHFKMLYLAVFALFIAVAIAGCSEQEKTGLEKVKETGEVSFAMSGGYPPFNFYNKTNELVGFDVDVAKEVAKRLGVKLKPVTTEWSGIIEGLRSGIYSGILGSMAATEQRKEVVDFSIPYYYSGAQMFVRADGPFESVQGLKDHAVGLVTGTTFEQDAKNLGVTDIRLYKDDTSTLTELSNGVIAGVITDRVVGVNAMNSGKFNIKPLGSPLRREDIAVAFRKEDKTLTDEVNKILTQMHEDGTLTALSMKWLNVDITKK